MYEGRIYTTRISKHEYTYTIVYDLNKSLDSRSIRFITDVLLTIEKLENNNFTNTAR